MAAVALAAYLAFDSSVASSAAIRHIVDMIVVENIAVVHNLRQQRFVVGDSSDFADFLPCGLVGSVV